MRREGRHARHRRHHPPGRADGLPRHPDVGPAAAGGDDAGRPHRGRGAGVEPLAHDHGRRLVRGRHADRRRGQARDRLPAGFRPGGPPSGRHPPGAFDPDDRVVGAGRAHPRADPRRGVPERVARWPGRRRRDRALPRLVLVPGGTAWPQAPRPGRRARDRGPAPPADPAARPAHSRAPAGQGADPRLPARRHPVPAPERDPAHHRLGHHRLGQDGADLRPRGTDPSQGRALRDLRQDGGLHAHILRPRPRRAAQSARRPGAALVAVPGGPPPPRLRHDGRRPDPPAARQRRPVLGHRRPAALRERRGRLLGAGRHREPGARRPPPEDRPHGACPGHGGHGRAVHRRSRQPEDGPQRARHADGERERARVPARRGRAVLDPAVGVRGKTRAGSCS